MNMEEYGELHIFLVNLSGLSALVVLFYHGAMEDM